MRVLSGAKVASRKALTEQGVFSNKVLAALDAVVAQYLDAHDNFDRISDEPEWVLRFKPARREAGR